MATYKTINTLSNVDAAYIAGLIDGEGTVTLTKEHANERRRLVVSISSTERSLLDFVHNSTGVGKITNKRTYNAKHTPSYCYKVTNRQALELLRQIQPYLHGYKSKRSSYALEHYISVTPRNGHYSQQKLKAREEFEQNFLKILA